MITDRNSEILKKILVDVACGSMWKHWPCVCCDIPRHILNLYHKHTQQSKTMSQGNLSSERAQSTTDALRKEIAPSWTLSAVRLVDDRVRGWFNSNQTMVAFLSNKFLTNFSLIRRGQAVRSLVIATECLIATEFHRSSSSSSSSSSFIFIFI